jgi:hypothetical protein
MLIIAERQQMNLLLAEAERQLTEAWGWERTPGCTVGNSVFLLATPLRIP